MVVEVVCLGYRLEVGSWVSWGLVGVGMFGGDLVSFVFFEFG